MIRSASVRNRAQASYLPGDIPNQFQKQVSGFRAVRTPPDTIGDKEYPGTGGGQYLRAVLGGLAPVAVLSAGESEDSGHGFAAGGPGLSAGAAGGKEGVTSR